MNDALPESHRRPRSETRKTPSSQSRRVGTVTQTWLGMTLLHSRMLLLQIGSLLAATVAIFTWYDRYYNDHPRLALVIVTCSILYILCFGTVPQAWRLYRQKRRDALSLPDYTEIPRKYFRLDPYVAATANEFRRDDNAHVEVLEWIETQPIQSYTFRESLAAVKAPYWRVTSSQNSSKTGGGRNWCEPFPTHFHRLKRL